jgi:hypothetical protein
MLHHDIVNGNVQNNHQHKNQLLNNIYDLQIIKKKKKKLLGCVWISEFEIKIFKEQLLVKIA